MCVTDHNPKDSFAVQLEQVAHNLDTDGTLFALLGRRFDLPPWLADSCKGVEDELAKARQATLQAYKRLSEYPELFQLDHQEPLD